MQNFDGDPKPAVKRCHCNGRVKSQSCLGGISTSTKCCCTYRCQISLNLYAGRNIDEHELNMYTTDRISKAGGKFDELDYWRLEQSRYPHLSRIARKFLMICASSTPSERCYFQARLFIPSVRNRLSQVSLKQGVLPYSWQKYNNK